MGSNWCSQAPSACTNAWRPADIAARWIARSSFDNVSLPLGQGISTVRLIVGTQAPSVS